MESFKSTYVRRCQELAVEPHGYILEQLGSKKCCPLTENIVGDENAVPPNIPSKKKAGDKFQLDLSGHTQSLKNIRALSDALQSDVVFVKLSLADALLGDDGTVVLAQSLKTNQTLLDLDLRGNNIRSDGAVAISQLLKLNAVLQTLSLEWNAIGIWESGISSLADALTINQTLVNLDLRNNKIGPHSGEILAKSLKHNTSLRKLDIRWNNLGLIGARAILDMLKWNTTLQNIELAGNDVPDEYLRGIEIALERNRQHRKSKLDETERANYVSAAFQKLSSEHASTIDALKSKLSGTETESKYLESKLRLASEEIESSQMGIKVLQTKYVEEKARHDALKKKFEELENVLNSERKEFSGRCQGILNDLMEEREKRARLEESHKQEMNVLKEKCLQSDAKLKEVELKVEVVLREKNILNSEIQTLHDQISNIHRDYESKMKKMNDAFEKQVGEMEEQKRQVAEKVRSELTAQQAQLIQQFKIQSDDFNKLQAAHQQLKTVLQNKDIEWDNMKRDIYRKVKEEEGQLRQDIVKQNQHLLGQREHLQKTLETLNTKHRAALMEFEQRQKQDREIRESLTDSLHRLKAEKTTSDDELARLRQNYQKIQDDYGELRRKLQDKESLEKEIQKWRDEAESERAEVKRLQKQLERIREEEVKRARDLEKAIVGYVRSVERAETK